MVYLLDMLLLIVYLLLKIFLLYNLLHLYFHNTNFVLVSYLYMLDVTGIINEILVLVVVTYVIFLDMYKMMEVNMLVWVWYRFLKSFYILFDFIIFIFIYIYLYIYIDIYLNILNCIQFIYMSFIILNIDI